MKSRIYFVLGSLAMIVPLVGCGSGGGGGSGSSGDATVAILLTDAPTDTLTALSLSVVNVTLVDSGGRATENLLVRPVDVELIELSGTQALIGLSGVPPAVYDEVRLEIDPTSVQARDRSGKLVPITVVHATASALLGSGLVIEAGHVGRLRCDVRLDRAIRERSGGLDFDLDLQGDAPTGELALSEVRCRVTTKDEDQSRFRGDLIFADGRTMSRSFMDVTLDSSSILLKDDGGLFDSKMACFSAMDPGGEFVVHGWMREDGSLFASSVEQDAGRDLVVVEGTIVSLDLAMNRLDLRLLQIEQGQNLVDGNTGPDGSLTVAWDDGTVFVCHDDRDDDHHHRGDDGSGWHGDGWHGDGHDDRGGGHGRDGTDHGPGSESDLRVGQQVCVKFLSFDTPPFVAHKLQIDDWRPTSQATIVGTSALPAEVTVHLDPFDPAIIAGLVTSDATDVRASLSTVEVIFLDLHQEPEIQPSDLLLDQHVSMRGEITGATDEPSLAPTVVQVRPGKLRGTMTGMDGPSHTIVVDVAAEEDPFGGPKLGDSVSVRLETSAVYEGEAQGESQLAALWTNRPPGTDLLVGILGIGDGQGGVRAFEIHSALISRK